MKRTNVVLDEELLEEAVRLSGEPTYARTIERALQEMVRRARVGNAFAQLTGSGAWAGSLTEMRADAPVVRETRGIYRPRKRRPAR
jgi:Arc/MetJ family transcription regulator